METIRNTVMSACIAAACISLLGGMTAGTKLGRCVRFIGELVMALILITPFTGGAAVSEYPFTAETFPLCTDDISERYRETVCYEAEEKLRAAICAALDKAGADYESIAPELHISEDWSISIDRVRIKAGSSGAEEVIRAYLGEETEIVYDDSEKYP